MRIKFIVTKNRKLALKRKKNICKMVAIETVNLNICVDFKPIK